MEYIELPVWYTEIINAAIQSIIWAIIYMVVLVIASKHREFIKKVVNFLLATYTWMLLLSENVQNSVLELGLVINNYKLVNIALTIATITMVNVALDVVTKDR